MRRSLVWKWITSRALSRSVSSLLILVLVPVFAPGCGEDGDGGGTGPTTPGTVTVSAAERDFLPQLFSAGYSASLLALDAMNEVANAVFVATRDTNAPDWLLTGTVTQTGPGLLDYQYSAGPADRMVLVRQNGSTVEVVLTDFRLDPTVALQSYVNGDYYVFVDLHAGFDFSYSGGGSTLQISSTSLQGPGSTGTQYERAPQWTRTITGTLQVAAETVTLDVTETGSRVFSLNPGQSTASDDRGTLTGTITWGGRTITVNESARYQLEKDVTSLDGTPQYTVLVLDRTCASSVQMGGRTFGFQDALVRSSSRNGVVNELATWVVQGSLRVDGQAAGSLRFTQTPALGIQPPRCEVDLGEEAVVLTGATLGG